MTLALAIVARSRAVRADPDASYKAKREQLAKELEETQKALADAKGQRAQLQARVESLIAQAMQERAQALLLSNEQTALQQLDALLSTSQTNLLAQRDRFAALSECRRRAHGRDTRRAASRRLVAVTDHAVGGRHGR